MTRTQDARLGHQVELLPDIARIDGISREAFRAFDISHLFPEVEIPTPVCARPRVASILDEFSDHGFRYEADLVRLTPRDWRVQLETARPSFVLVESAWRGNGGTWRKLIEHCDRIVDNPFVAMMSYCRRSGLPTVFWNKEDPPNFDCFVAAARLADLVFTSDADCLPRYRRMLGHNRIAALPFAAQPRIHNPIGKREHPDLEVAFAGTWYSHKHPQRLRLLPMLLDAATHRQLHIFDRQARVLNPAYRYPLRFQPFLHDRLTYPRMLRAYRDFRLILNVNSVVDSPTMFARRVLETLASQTSVISTPARGVEILLDGVVPQVATREAARAEVDRLLDDDWARAPSAHLGWRKVMRAHTYAERFRCILMALGSTQASVLPRVTVIATHQGSGNLMGLAENLLGQTYPHLEILLAPGTESLRPVLERFGAEIRPLSVPAEMKTQSQGGEAASLLALLRLGAEQGSGTLLTLLDSRDRHGAELIWDLVDTLSFAPDPIVTKGCYAARVAGGDRVRLQDGELRFQRIGYARARALLTAPDLFTGGLDWRTGEEDRLWPMDGGTALDEGAFSGDPFNYVRNGHTVEGYAPPDAPDAVPMDAILL